MKITSIASNTNFIYQSDRVVNVVRNNETTEKRNSLQVKNLNFKLDETQSNNTEKPKRSKIKEFLIDFCIGWTIWDIISQLWKYFNNKGKKPPLP